jgi:hypothetical protein
MAEVGRHPVWALEDTVFGDVAPDVLGLSRDLVMDLENWAGNFARANDPDAQLEDRWDSSQFDAHIANGWRLAERLKAERPDLTVFVQDPAVGVSEVHAAKDADRGEGS